MTYIDQNIDHREAFIAGLRAAADFYEQHPVVPVPEPRDADGIALMIDENVFQAAPNLYGDLAVWQAVTNAIHPQERHTSAHFYSVICRFGPVAAGVWITRRHIDGETAAA